MSDAGWKFVDSYTVTSYRCGLRAGDRVALRRDLHIRDHESRPTGRVHREGEVWDVLLGSIQDPGVVWFRQADGESHTWDDESGIFDWFALLPRAE